MDDDEICQDVVEVTDYSSQYGSYNSISYVALNVIGAPEVFPEYGDYSETFSARTYGPWWLQHSISDRNFNTILPKERHVKSQDYVELQYEHHVYPATVTVFETYNPGSVVRILAYDRLKNRWKELWVGKPTKGAEACAWPRPLSSEDTFVTRVLRLEFHHAHLDYHAQIDAVLLVGTFKRPESVDSESDEQSITAVTSRSSCKEETFLPSRAGFHSLPTVLESLLRSYILPMPGPSTILGKDRRQRSRGPSEAMCDAGETQPLMVWRWWISFCRSLCEFHGSERRASAVPLPVFLPIR